MAAEPGPAASPRRTLSLFDACALIVGIMLGAGIFRAPAIVADQVESEALFLSLWLAGGLISLAGALCYAELASRYPHAGGEYHFLRRAYGDRLAFLFAWSRMSVVQTGAIAAIAFVFGDYAARIAPFGSHGSAVYAALLVVAVTALNATGTAHGKWLQNLLMIALAGAIVAIVAAGLAFEAPQGREPLVRSEAREGIAGLAVIFVMLTYGGWNEAAYLGAELKRERRDIVRAFVIGIVTVTVIYLGMNLAYLRVLGLEGLRGARAPAADLVQAAFGAFDAAVLSVLVMAAAAAALNATVFTGARTNYAFGCDQRLFAFLGRWHPGANAPLRALLWQGAVALAMVALASRTPDAFQTLVVYTAPAFWFFFLLTGAALFVLRRRTDAAEAAHFRVPLYPLTPLVFCAACGYMLISCIDYAAARDAGGSLGARLGIGILALGVPLMILNRRLTSAAS